MPDFTQEEIAVVTTTTASMDDARKLARAIIDEALAACVQLDLIAASLYRWEGQSCEDAEVRLTIKTMPAKLAGLERLFGKAHPYELPQFVVTRCGAGAAYAAWVRAEVA